MQHNLFTEVGQVITHAIPSEASSQGIYPNPEAKEPQQLKSRYPPKQSTRKIQTALAAQEAMECLGASTTELLSFQAKGTPEEGEEGEEWE